jgi:peptide/nickel transport system substrate-binding protein
MLSRTPRRFRRGAVLASATMLAVGGLAACHGSAPVVSDAPQKGGTLQVILSGGGIDNLDPQEISLATDANVSHLLNRTLTTTTPGGKLVPDLATDTGRPSPDRTIWEFTLRPGVKWQDGSPVTCQDVQYGVERRFAPVIDQAQGLPYPKTYLQDNSTPYDGPFTLKTLNSIVCVDAQTIQFHLQRPVGDFGYTVSVNTFAPVKASADNDHQSDGKPTDTNFAPFANGPYEVDPTQSKVLYDKQGGIWYATDLTLVRNPFWDPTTDPNRKAYPDKIVISSEDDRTKTTNSIIQSATQKYQDAIDLDADVTPNFVQQVINDPDLSKRAITGVSGATRYFAINSIRQKKVECRQALEYAFDKRSWRYEVGGAIFGPLATSLIPPNLLAHGKFDDYETTTLPDGDPTKASSLWTKNNCGDAVTIAFPNIAGVAQLMSTVVAAYQKAGITVHLAALNPQSYYSQIGLPSEPYDMLYAGWVPDWPNGSAVIPPLFNAATVTAAERDPKLKGDNLNFSMVTDQVLQTQITEAFAQGDLSAQYHLWAQLDRTIMDQAYVIPVLYPSVLRMTGTKVRGAVVTPAFGEPDLSAMGVVP